jgi:hypothetical protein
MRSLRLLLKLRSLRDISEMDVWYNESVISGDGTACGTTALAPLAYVITLRFLSPSPPHRAVNFFPLQVLLDLGAHLPW